MHRHLRRLAPLAVLAAFAVLLPTTAGAQDLYTFSASALGGFGGSPDATPGGSVDNPSFQLGFAVITEPRTHVGLRVGQVSFGKDELLEGLLNADLTYATLAGEYRFDQRFYEAGMYLGIGGYKLEGTRPGAGSYDESALGFNLGVTGEFSINRRFGVLVELSGHYTDLEEVQFFAMGHAGVVMHF